jgi:uncharacterized membrane protein
MRFARSPKLTAALMLAGTAVAVAAVASGVLVLAVPGGIALAAVLPGWAATRVLFPRRALSVVEQVALTPVFSFGVLIFGGLLLYLVGVPLHAVAWSALTAIVTAALTGVAYLRRPLAADPPAQSDAADGDGAVTTAVESAVRSEPASGKQLARRLAPLAVAVLLLAGATTLSVHSARSASSGATFSELTIVPAGPDPGSQPTRSVVVGLTSHEARTTDFRVQVSGPESYSASYDVRLVPGDQWAETMEVPSSGTVTVHLYRQPDLSTPYRTVWLAGVSGGGDDLDRPPPNVNPADPTPSSVPPVLPGSTAPTSATPTKARPTNTTPTKTTPTETTPTGTTPTQGATTGAPTTNPPATTDAPADPGVVG